MKEAKIDEKEKEGPSVLFKKNSILSGSSAACGCLYHTAVLDGALLLYEKYGDIQHASIYILAQGNALG